jgi:hypothetical protein
MHDGGESDSSIVPVKRSNKAEACAMIVGEGNPYTGTQVETPETAKGEPKVGIQGDAEATEVVEGRGLAKGNLVEQSRGRTQCRVTLSHELDRVRQVAATLVRHYPRQEPGAVIPHAGIRAGGAG